MGRKTYEAESGSDMEDGGAKLNAPTKQANVVKSTDAMDVDVPPTPAEKRQAAAAARAERAARRKQRREELAAQGSSQISSLASTPNPESEPASPTKTSQEKKSRRKKTEKKTPKKAVNAEETDEKAEENVPEASAAETDTPSEPISSAAAPATDTEPCPFVIDVKPIKFEAKSTSVTGYTTSNAPSSVSGADSQHKGLNRAARRRLMQIENRRLAIKKELGIAVDSDDREAEVDALLSAWTTQFDERAEARAAKKAAKKESARSNAKGKLLKGHSTNNYEKQKQIKKQKLKEALRARQEGS